MQVVRSLATMAGFVATLLCASPAPAVPVQVVIGEWTSFQYDGTGSDWRLFGLVDPVEFLVTTDTNAELHVVDTFVSGDRFEVFDFDQTLGLTSVPKPGADTDSFDTAFNDPSGAWSRGTFTLAPGTHRITGIAVDSPFGRGTGGIRIVLTSIADPAPARVSEPTTLALLLAMFVVGWQRFRRLD